MSVISAWQMQLLQNTGYIILNVLAFIFLWFFAYRAANSFNFSSTGTVLFLVGLTISFIAGARFFHILFYSETEWSLLFEPVPYGFSLFGGLLSAVIYLFAAAWKHKLHLWHLLDVNAPGLIGYVAISKIGCFINGCCFGTPTIMPWGIPYTAGSQAYQYYIAGTLNNLDFHTWKVYSDLIHPVQIYESVIALLFLLIALALLRRKVMPGLVFLFITGIYSLTRLGLLSLRANTEMGTFFYMLPWLYIAVASLSLLILMQRLYFQYKLVNRGSDL
jgi:phosphatidylglycerol:prolipoprotein diacylglycerol transferase